MTTLSDVRLELTNNLTIHLQQELPQHPIAECYHYAIFPPGKLLRPLLVKAIWSDIGGNDFFKPWGVQSPHSYLASLIELHHAYTLIHDDLPCMDNDDMRRGKPTTHKKFGEWRAVLVGDGLLNLSYSLLSHIPPSKSQPLLKLLGQKLGPKGLIQGQVLDLETQQKKEIPFKEIMEIHRLKTANLMQVAILGSYQLLPNSLYKKETLSDLALFCNHLGIHFQLLDDLQDLVTQNGHEEEINPFIDYPQKCSQQLFYSLSKMNELLTKHKLHHLQLTLQEYWKQNRDWIQNHKKVLKGKVESEPIMVMLDRLNHAHGR